MNGGMKNGNYMLYLRHNVRRSGRYGDYVFGTGGKQVGGK